MEIMYVANGSNESHRLVVSTEFVRCVWAQSATFRNFKKSYRRKYGKINKRSKISSAAIDKNRAK